MRPVITDAPDAILLDSEASFSRSYDTRMALLALIVVVMNGSVNEVGKHI